MPGRGGKGKLNWGRERRDWHEDGGRQDELERERGEGGGQGKLSWGGEGEGLGNGG